MAYSELRWFILLSLYFQSYHLNPAEQNNDCKFPGVDVSKCDTSSSQEFTMTRSTKENCEILSQITRIVCEKLAGAEIPKFDKIPEATDICKQITPAVSVSQLLPFWGSSKIAKNVQSCNEFCVDSDLNTNVCLGISIGVRILSDKQGLGKIDKNDTTPGVVTTVTGKSTTEENKPNNSQGNLYPVVTTLKPTTNNQQTSQNTQAAVNNRKANDTTTITDVNQPNTAGKDSDKLNGDASQIQVTKDTKNNQNLNVITETGPKNGEKPKIHTELTDAKAQTTTNPPTTAVPPPSTPGEVGTPDVSTTVEAEKTPETEKPVEKLTESEKEKVSPKDTEDEDGKQTLPDGTDEGQPPIDSETDDGGQPDDAENNGDIIYTPEDGEQLRPPIKTADAIDLVPDQSLGGSMPGPDLPQYADSHFFIYFLTAVVLCVLLYLAFHNKQKIIALIIEGRHERRRRSSNVSYKKLDNNLDQVLHGSKGTSVTPAHIIY